MEMESSAMPCTLVYDHVVIFARCSIAMIYVLVIIYTRAREFTLKAAEYIMRMRRLLP